MAKILDTDNFFIRLDHITPLGAKKLLFYECSKESPLLAYSLDDCTSLSFKEEADKAM
jgi:hypothetical protein